MAVKLRTFKFTDEFMDTVRRLGERIGTTGAAETIRAAVVRTAAENGVQLSQNIPEKKSKKTAKSA